jgi:hypothetical protein
MPQTIGSDNAGRFLDSLEVIKKTDVVLLSRVYKEFEENSLKLNSNGFSLLRDHIRRYYANL